MTQDRKDLKIQALLEKISKIVTNYENELSDLRVAITIVSEELDEAKAENLSLKEQQIAVPEDVEEENPSTE